MLQSMLSLLLFSCLLGRMDCTGQKNLTAKQGTDATLECLGRKNATSIMLRWEKPDLSEEYVIVIINGVFQKDLQHDRFKGRVELKDKNWNKTGDLSVILKHVTMNDAGRYECHAGYDEQEPEHHMTITLKVEEPGQRGGQSGNGENKDKAKVDGGQKINYVGVSVVTVVLVVVVIAGFWIYRTYRNQSNPGYQRPAGQDNDEQEDEL